MRRTIVITVAIAAMIGLAIVGGSVNAQSTNWSITEFASMLTVQEDGRLDVVETISVDFGEEALHGIYRDLPVVYAQEDGDRYTIVEVIDVMQDGAPAKQLVTRNGANMRIRIGDPDITISGTHQYRIHYIVSGILLPFEQYDEVYWNVTGNDWVVPILSSRAEVRLPQGTAIQAACYVGGYGSQEPCDAYQITNESSTVQFEHPTLLSGGEGLTVAVGFTKGAVPIIVVPPPTPVQDLVTRPLPIALFAMTLALGIGGLVFMWRRMGRDLKQSTRHEAVIVEYESPEHLRPGELGVLMDEQADTLDVSATVVDLAVRGYLEITETQKKTWWKEADYELTRKKPADQALLSYEASLLGAMFKTGDVVKLSDLKMKFHSDLAKVKKELYEHVVAKKLFTHNPSNIRLYHTLGAVPLMVIGIFIAIIGASAPFPDTLRSIMIGIGPALGITGFCYIFLANKGMPQRTAEGRALYIKALGYKEYITHVETYRQRFFEKENTFMEVLPFAMIFGATKKLADAMKKMGVTPPQQTWYHGNAAFTMASFSSSMDSFSRSLSTTMASSPHSSGSGGGGSSGGGGGGGGGGGW